MNIEFIAQDSKTGKTWELSELITTITWETELTSQPGKLSFSYVKDPTINLSPGSRVSFKINSKGVFFGYVFKITKKDNDLISVIAYDQMRYLKNKDTYVITGMTASQIFVKLCKDFNLKYKVTNASTYVLADRVFDNKSLFEIIQRGIDETLIYNKNWYMIRDNFGTLEFVNLASLKTDLFVGDESLLTGFSYEHSIDSDTYNQVKLIQENSETKKRKVYKVFDSSTIKQWGTLQYFEKLDEQTNSAKIAERAQTILSLKNRATKTLKLNCLGDLRVAAGNSIMLGIDELSATDDLPKIQYFTVTRCSHKFENDLHTMDLEVQVTI